MVGLLPRDRGVQSICCCFRLHCLSSAAACTCGTWVYPQLSVPYVCLCPCQPKPRISPSPGIRLLPFLHPEPLSPPMQQISALNCQLLRFFANIRCVCGRRQWFRVQEREESDARGGADSQTASFRRELVFGFIFFVRLKGKLNPKNHFVCLFSVPLRYIYMLYTPLDCKLCGAETAYV
ncbi:hypothetical protein XENTR_v10024913 [Xenopus tropicalis]|nr:hypothetical protein XENTR_v10024913 [Xenopus tropicalis]